MAFEYAALARKYATAFFIVAGDSFDEHDYEYAGELRTFFIKHRSALGLLNVPILEPAKMHMLVDSLANGFHAAEFFKRLLLLLIRHRRVLALPSILHHIRELYCHREHMVEFTIASSHELDKSERNVLIKLLAQATGKRIRSTYRIDPQLIAGVRMQSDNLGWEHSVRKQLRDVKYSTF